MGVDELAMQGTRNQQHNYITFSRKISSSVRKRFISRAEAGFHPSAYYVNTLPNNDPALNVIMYQVDLIFAAWYA